MIFAEISAYPLTVIAIVVVIFAVLLSRTLKRDSGVRIARLGVFIERKRYRDPEEGEIVSQPESDEAGEHYWPHDDDDATQRIEQ